MSHLLHTQNEVITLVSLLSGNDHTCSNPPLAGECHLVKPLLPRGAVNQAGAHWK